MCICVYIYIYIYMHIYIHMDIYANKDICMHTIGDSKWGRTKRQEFGDKLVRSLRTAAATVEVLFH